MYTLLRINTAADKRETGQRRTSSSSLPGLLVQAIYLYAVRIRQTDIVSALTACGVDQETTAVRPSL